MSNFLKPANRLLVLYERKNMTDVTNSSIDLSNGYYSISECAKRLAKTPQTIYMWIDKGQFAPVIKVGSTYLVKVQDFEDWITSIIRGDSIVEEDF
jgi:excisionase family DNA binding protein